MVSEAGGSAKVVEQIAGDASAGERGAQGQVYSGQPVGSPVALSFKNQRVAQRVERRWRQPPDQRPGGGFIGRDGGRIVLIGGWRASLLAH